MNFKKVDSLIILKERACHKQTQAMGRPNPNKSGRTKKNLKKWSCAKQTTRWVCPTRLKELGVCLVIPRKAYALKKLKDVGWPK